MITTCRRNVAWLLLAVLALCGCAEDGSCMGACGDGVVDPFEECDDGNIVDDDGCSGDCTIEIDPGLPPTLASIQATIFTPICAAVCHRPGGGTPMSLVDEATSFASLVNTPAILCSVLRVDPGDPDRSCLVLKLEGSGLVSGQRMPPPPNAPLPQDQIDQIRQWILDGAPP